MQQTGGPVSSMPDLGGDEKLLHIVENWLRHERDTRQARQDAKKPEAKAKAPSAFAATSRHMAFFR